MDFNRTVLFLLILLLSSSCSSTGESLSKYKRSEYKHWVDKDGDCQNERAEMLIKASQMPVKFKTNRRCIVVSGKWLDPYSGKIFFKASDLDIDHIIPLKFAHENGANKWNKKWKEKFSNDHENLIVVSKRQNRSKGAKGPQGWMPANKQFHCNYLSRWRNIQKKYRLGEKGRSIASKELKCTEVPK